MLILLRVIEYGKIVNPVTQHL